MKTFVRFSVLFTFVSGLLFAGCSKEQARPLAQPQLTHTEGATWYQVEWEAVSHAAGYSVSLDEGGTWSATQAATKFRKEGLTPETLYHVWVKSVGDGTKYIDSKASQLEITTAKEEGENPELQKLQAPVPDCQANVRDARITWAAVGNASGYRVSVDDCATWENTQTALYYDCSGLSPETTYKVHVKAVGDGETYCDSDPAEVEFTTGANELVKLQTPALDCQANVRNARVAWAAVENASGYQISVDGCATWENAQTGLYYDYGGLSPETTYKVHVKAVGDGETYGDSDPAEIEFTTRPDELPQGEYSYKPVEWPEDIISGQKFLIGYVAASRVKIMDKTSVKKPAGVDLSGQYDVMNDLFPSNSITDGYAYTIKDAGGGYYYLENPEGKKLGWTSGTDFNFSATGDNTKWSIAEGNDRENLSFHIKNVKSMSEVASHRGIIYTYRTEGTQSFDLFAPYAMSNIDHTDYFEPRLYMLDKPLESIDPGTDPEPEPGETLMYVPLTDPDKLYSGEKCLVAYADAGTVRIMNYQLADGETEGRPAAVDMKAHYLSSENMFVHNATTSPYEFTFTSMPGGYYITNSDGKSLTSASGTAVFFSGSLVPESVWKLSKGVAAGTLRIGSGTRSIAYNSYNDGENHYLFGNYDNSNIGTGNYKEVKLYVLRSIRHDEVEEPQPTEETGFPAQWDMPNASITGGKCYAAIGNTKAYVTVSGATGLTFSGSGENRYLVATGWNVQGAAWVIEVPVTNLTATETTVEITTQSSNTGPKDFVVSYSTDGIHYTSTNKTYTCDNSNRNTSIEFTPTVTGFPSSLFIKLEVKAGSQAVNGSAIASGGTSRLVKMKLMKWYKE